MVKAMKNSNKILLLSLFLILFISISAISAADAGNDNITSDINKNDEILAVEETGHDDSSDKLSIKEEKVLSESNSMSYDEFYSKVLKNSKVNLDSDVIFTSGDTSGAVPINQFTEITIDGNGHTIDLKSKSKLFVIPSGHTLILKNANIKNAYDSSNADGSILNSGTLKITNCTFTNSKTKSSGGVIKGDGSSTITNSKFDDCTASDKAGVIWGNSVVLKSCTFTKCTAGNMGGAVFGVGVKIYDSTFVDNVAGCGGAVGGKAYIYNSNFKNCKSTKAKSAASKTDGGGACSGEFPEVKGCNFTNCKATNGGFGGALRGTTNVYDCNFVNCAAKQGGAIRGKGTTSGCTFEKCVATSDMGGAIFTEKATVDKCEFRECSASKSNAGAVYLGNNAKITNSKFIGCSAPKGCGGAVYGNGVVVKCIFEKNKAKCGGAVSSYSLTVKSSTFTANSAGKGGAAYNTKALTSCKFNKNKATYGGAVYNAQTVTSCKFGDNSAKYGAISYNDVNVVFKKAGIKNTLKIEQGLFYNNKHKLTLTSSKIVNTGKFGKYFNYNTGVFIYNKNTIKSSYKVKAIAAPRNVQKS